jgi:CheY-like chemotaxis protein
MSDSAPHRKTSFREDAIFGAPDDGHSSPSPSHAEINRTLAHDVRSPMNAVLGLCDLLALSDPLTDKQKEFVRALKASTGNLMEQVTRLLEHNGYKAPTPIVQDLPHPPPPHTQVRPKVLLVDDYAPNALVVATYLEKFGYDYDIAENGIDAVSLAKRNRYIACLMDVQMHDMDGIEATMAIRDFERLEHKGHLPIIGITAHALSGDRERCLDAGMDEYVAKPFNPAELESRLSHIARAA